MIGGCVFPYCRIWKTKTSRNVARNRNNAQTLAFFSVLFFPPNLRHAARKNSAEISRDDTRRREIDAIFSPFFRDKSWEIIFCLLHGQFGQKGDKQLQQDFLGGKRERKGDKVLCGNSCDDARKKLPTRVCFFFSHNSEKFSRGIFVWEMPFLFLCP